MVSAPELHPLHAVPPGEYSHVPDADPVTVSSSTKKFVAVLYSRICKFGIVPPQDETCLHANWRLVADDLVSDGW